MKLTQIKAQIATKNDKNSKMNQFFKFSCIFCQIFGNSIEQNAENAQKRLNWLSNRAVWGDNCSFVRKICHNDPKIFKKSHFFKQFLFHFQRYHGLEL